MKSPDEIKRGLECRDCKQCPYSDRNSKDGDYHCGEIDSDALAYIRRLEREREAFLAEAKGMCGLCKAMYKGCNESPCAECMDGNNWEWRGVKEEVNDTTGSCNQAT